MLKNNRLTLYIFIAMLIGVGVGYYVYANYPKATAVSFADNVKLLTTIFLRLVNMIIAPVVFSNIRPNRPAERVLKEYVASSIPLINTSV